ncbi:cask-interacting protein (caskin) 1,2 [Histomonas meleagridis]|uniref:cask-interacting protein (caskin) n=1 Tax=Histomonas meleagridis TaxID=135588 RepID=UPI003559AD35|nr:cask-interacting protein (caskin) 1,2 [Histomonas meleagridis]KAH0796595.1 cask-interacting protein (caskin) [Histomonas meleagridis]
MIQHNVVDKSITKNIQTKFFAHYRTKRSNKVKEINDPIDHSFKENYEELSKNDWELHKKLIEEGVNPSEIAKVIRNDDNEKLQEMASQQNFNINQIIDPSLYERYSYVNKWNVSLIDYAAFFGSTIKCFRYLMLNGAKMENTGRFAVASGSEEIIHLCEQNHSTFKGAYEAAIRFHQNDIFKYLYENKMEKFDGNTQQNQNGPGNRNQQLPHGLAGGPNPPPGHRPHQFGANPTPWDLRTNPNPPMFGRNPNPNPNPPPWRQGNPNPPMFGRNPNPNPNPPMFGRNPNPNPNPPPWRQGNPNPNPQPWRQGNPNPNPPWRKNKPTGLFGNPRNKVKNYKKDKDPNSLTFKKYGLQNLIPSLKQICISSGNYEILSYLEEESKEVNDEIFYETEKIGNLYLFNYRGVEKYRTHPCNSLLRMN